MNGASCGRTEVGRFHRDFISVIRKVVAGGVENCVGNSSVLQAFAGHVEIFSFGGKVGTFGDGNKVTSVKVVARIESLSDTAVGGTGKNNGFDAVGGVADIITLHILSRVDQRHVRRSGERSDVEFHGVKVLYTLKIGHILIEIHTVFVEHARIDTAPLGKRT